MTQPGDQIAAAAEGRGRLRASHAGREQVIAPLKAAYVQGRLAKHELDARLSQTFASRTYAELAALTADLPVGLADTLSPRQPARARGQGRIPRPGLVLTVTTAVYLGVWPLAFFLPRNGEGEAQGGLALVTMTGLVYLLVLVFAGMQIIVDWQDKHSGAQLPRRPAPGVDGQPSPRVPSADSGRQLTLRRVLPRTH
jgi:hypothetical protein